MFAVTILEKGPLEAAISMVFDAYRSEDARDVVTREDMKRGADSLIDLVTYGWLDEFEVRVETPEERRDLVDSAVAQAFEMAGLQKGEGMRFEHLKELCESNLKRLRRVSGSQVMPSISLFLLPFLMNRGTDGKLCIFDV